MKGILYSPRQPCSMPTTLRTEMLGGKIPAGWQGRHDAGREEWRTHLEKAGEATARQEGVLSGVNRPAAGSPSSQQKGKLWRRRPKTQSREGAARSSGPSVLAPLSCFP